MPAALQSAISFPRIGREASEMSVSPRQNFLKPPPVPEMPTVTLTAFFFAFWNSSATASVIGYTVLEPSTLTTCCCANAGAAARKAPRMTHAFTGMLLNGLDNAAQTITLVLPVCDRRAGRPELQVTGLQGEGAPLEQPAVELAMRQAGENLDPAHQGPEIVAHRVVGIAGGRIGLDSPVGDERIARPFRERLAGRDVAQRDDEVHARRAPSAAHLQDLRGRKPAWT